MCLKNGLLGFALALTLTSCATSNKNKTAVSSNIGYVSQNNIVINKTSGVEDKLDEANDCNILDKFVYYTNKYAPQPHYRGYRGYGRPYGYKKPVVCDPNQYTNVGALWAVDPYQNIEESMLSKQTRTNAKGFQFNANGVAMISMNSQEQNSCYVLTNAKGTLIPVRNGADPYLFSNPLLAVKNAQRKKQNAINTANSRLVQAKNSLKSTYTQLVNSRAWDGAQCVLPKQRPLPRKPETVSMEEAQFQANGYCAELSARRENPMLVVEALGAVFLDQIIKDWMQWKQESNRRESCAVVERSQAVDWLSGLCKFSRNAMRGCIQTMIKECVSQSKNQCTSKLRYWHSEVARIRQEPRNLYQSCLQDQATVQQLQASIPTREADLKQANSITVPQDRRLKVSLEDAICHREQHRASL